MRTVYMDYAATTYVKPEVLEEMIPYFTQKFGNPSSFYGISRETKMAIDKARGQVAKALNCDMNEVYFTGGGSESDNWAISGVAHKMLKKGKNHIVTSKFEHHAVLHTLDNLKKEGFDVTYLDVHEDGLVRTDELERAITEKTALVTIMFANNEIGTVQPIEEIGQICRKNNVFFHTDAVQAVGHMKIDVKKLNVDLLSLSAHKFCGPKGVGALYAKKGTKFSSIIFGGAQESGRRAGTENLAGIVGMATALEEACNGLEEKNRHLLAMRNKLIHEVLKIKRSRLNGSAEKRLPGNASFCFEGIEGESLLLMLNAKGICASSGSACTSGSLNPSQVLLAIGLPHEIAHGSLRISLCHENTMKEIDYIVKILPKIVDRLRSMSPLWDRIVKTEG